MRKITYLMLTLALFIVGVGGAKAGVETVIKSIDYTTDPVTTTNADGTPYTKTGYPYYSQDGWWSATEATAPTLKNNSLEIVNDAENSYQLFINDWATVKKGYSYKARITYKSTVAGNVSFTFGTWGSSLNKNVDIEATDAWKNLLIDLGTANFVADASAHLIWKFTFAGTINIKNVEIIEVAPDLVTMTEVEKIEAPVGTTDIKNLTGTNGDWAKTVVYPKELAVQGAAFGNGNGDKESNHVNIEGYDYLCFYVTTAAANTAGLRVWIWDGVAGGAGSVKTLYAYPIADYATANYTTATKINAGVGTYVTKVTGYKYLKGVKAANDWGSPASVISMAYMCTGDPVAYTPTGETTVSGTEYLTDPAITCIDVTGLTTAGQTLDAANPNALFIAKEGVLNNTKNVMVGTTIANLDLTDGHPFAAPEGATATAATYTRTMSNQFGTICLPYAVSSNDDVKYYTLGALSGDVLTLTAVDNLAAGTPAIVEKVSGSSITAAGSGALAGVQVPGAGTLQLFGTFDAKTILASDYEGKSIYAIANNQFVQATNSINLPAFRAFFVSTPASANIRFSFDEGEDATAINALTSEGDVTIESIYSADGAQQSSLQKGMNVVKMSNGEVKKILVK
ncbi:MAG: hypothetical protein J5888_01195 [Bacteroidaceae bacterium]|nr:hypothetical protein [Bacteroidaceae bacterium]